MTHSRTQRLESEIQRVLATLIARELKDPRVGNVTITGVNLAADMASARVFFSPFASRHPPAEVHTGLTHAAGFLRGELGRRLGLRYAPRLQFQFDDSAAAAARLSGLIDRAVASDHARAGEPPAGTAESGERSPEPGAGREADSGSEPRPR